MLAAMQVAPDVAAGFLRVSFGPATERGRGRRASSTEWRRIAERMRAGGMIYLDYQATTPVAPEVLAAMRPWIEEKFANPHSASLWGSEAAAAIAMPATRSRRRSGSGRALRLHHGRDRGAQLGDQGDVRDSRRGASSSPSRPNMPPCSTRAEWLEGQGIEVVRLPVGADGLVDMGEAAAAIDDRTALVAAMLVNNEIGVIQPVAELARLAHAAGALMLCDAVQGFGRMAIPDGPDLVAISAHKIHGPKGVGGLVDARRGRARAVAPRRRAGAGAALGHAVDRLVRRAGRGGAAGGRAARADAEHVGKLHAIALAALGEGWTLNGQAQQRYRGNLNCAATASTARG